MATITTSVVQEMPLSTSAAHLS